MMFLAATAEVAYALINQHPEPLISLTGVKDGTIAFKWDDQSIVSIEDTLNAMEDCAIVGCFEGSSYNIIDDTNAAFSRGSSFINLVNGVFYLKCEGEGDGPYYNITSVCCFHQGMYAKAIERNVVWQIDVIDKSLFLIKHGA